MARVIVAQPVADEGVVLLRDAGHDVALLPRCTHDDLMQGIRDADGLLVRDARVTRAVIEAGSRLKVISRHGAGLDRIDLAAAAERGIAVTYTPIANSHSVAEHTVALMLALAKNFRVVDRATRAGRFGIRHELLGFELSGRTLGILGFGNVGRRLASIARDGFGMRVAVSDPYADRSAMTGAIDWIDDWRDLLRNADVVAIHLPLTAETRHIIDASALRLMKPTALLLNCARGEVVDESALVAALRDGTIAGAGIDVYDPDPPPDEHPLFALDNVIVTPHSAAHTLEAMRNMSVQAAQGLADVLAGKAPAWPASLPQPASSKERTT